MKGDFTRTTFDSTRHFSRVLMQQGRVTVDADPNEQTEILLHYLRTLAADLIGPFAAPSMGGGFSLISQDGKLAITAGRYYVDGILVENEKDCLYSAQPGYPAPVDDVILKEMSDPKGATFWVYLDVWERHITHLDVPAIREVALGGPDTCTRSQVVWQVKALEMDAPSRDIPSAAPAPAPTPAPAADAQRARLEEAAKQLKAQIDKTTDPEQRKKLEADLEKIKTQLAALDSQTPTPTPTPNPRPAPAAAFMTCDQPLEELVSISDASMTARVDPGFQSDDPCVLSPQAKYRGTENHLYRVEVHNGGSVATATFKWSRDNGSVVAAWTGAEGNDLIVSSARGFSAGCWVELSDDVLELLGTPGLLAKVAKVEGQTITIDPASIGTGASLAWTETLVNPKVRRWDQAEKGDIVLKYGAVPVVESPATKPEWLDLEDGIQVSFAADGEYRTGDYWLIPARVATGDIEWPEYNGAAAALAPSGIEHHYAPLGFVSWDNKQAVFQLCTCTFFPLSSCLGQGLEPSKGTRPTPSSTLRQKPASAPAKAKPAKRRRQPN